MTREDTRRENARRLAAKIGGKAEFGRFVGLDPSQVSQLIGPNPSKNIGNSISRRIEQAFDLPKEFLDDDHPELYPSLSATGGIEPTTAEIAGRLAEAMGARGIASTNVLARDTEIPLPTINRVLNGTGKKIPDFATVTELARLCGVSATWLYSGAGDRDVFQDGADDATPLRPLSIASDDRYYELPLAIGFIHAGVGADDGDLEYEDQVTIPISRLWVEKRGFRIEALRAVKVKGESNYPTMKDGDVAIINTADRDLVIGEYYAVNHHRKAVIKRVERESNIWYLASDNPLPKYRRQPVDDSETFVVGRMVKLEADF